MVSETAVILIVEDQEDDVLLIRRAFGKARLNNPVQVVRNGEDAIAYLSGEGRFANRAEYPLPALVLLDLKLPGLDGFDVLAWIRKREGTRGMPVIVLTSSNRIPDVNRAYNLGANSFFIKDIDFQNSVALADLLHRYWLRVAALPDSSRPAPIIPPKLDGQVPSGGDQIST